MNYLQATLAIFVLPTGATIVLVVAGLLWRRKTLCWIGIMVLWLASTPVVSDAIMRGAEAWAERIDPASMPESQAIVVLSEGRIQPPGETNASEWTDSDRFYGGISLYKAHKAPLLIFTGGWSPRRPTGKTEGEVLMEFAAELGVARENVVTTGKVSNTYDEARSVAALMARTGHPGAPPRILLVTSAYHMRRAQFLFERAGVHTIPFPVDFKVPQGEEFSLFRLLPAAASLKRTEAALREQYGFLFYWFRLN